MEPYHKRNFEVMTRSTRKIYVPHHFLLLTRGFFRHVIESINKIYHRTPYPAVPLWSLINSEEKVESFHKSRNFFSLLQQLSTLRVNFTLHPRCPPVPSNKDLPPNFRLTKRKYEYSLIFIEYSFERRAYWLKF